MTPLRLETPRLVMREFVAEDWREVHVYASDPEVTRYMLWGPNSLAETQAILRLRLDQQRAVPRIAYELAVTERESGKLIGAGALRIRDTTHRSGDLGYVLGKPAWGQGLGTEVASALVRLGVDGLGLHRLWATCDVDNLASARVLEKAGMLREGRLRHDKWVRGEWRDSFLYAIVAEA